jgi:TatA/E family protein of Tat protein translocase
MNLAWLFSGRPGLGELLLVVVCILLLFGARRIPDLARSLGQSISEFKKGRQEGAQDTEETPPKEPPSS